MNKLTKGFRDLVAEAEEEIEVLSPGQVRSALDSATGNLLLVDLRDIREVKKRRAHCRFVARASRHARILG